MNPLEIFGPILPWEMMVVVRRRRYYWLRSLFALILLLTLWMNYQEAFYTPQGLARTVTSAQTAEFARSFFLWYTGVQLAAVILLTPAYVATAIALEKERRTIDYLFTTDLRNHEIVLGKWSARTANVIMLMLAGLPILAFARLFGGI